MSPTVACFLCMPSSFVMFHNKTGVWYAAKLKHISWGKFMLFVTLHVYISQNARLVLAYALKYEPARSHPDEQGFPGKRPLILLKVHIDPSSSVAVLVS